MTVDVPGVPTTEEPLPVASPVDPTRPEVHLTPRQWARRNLFPSKFSTVLTLVFGLLLAYGLYRLAWFALVSSDWEIVRANLRLFMIGRFPLDEAWRLWGALYVVAAAVGLLSGAVVARAEMLADAAGRPLARPGRWSWVRRYWPALLALAVILAQTRTWVPTLCTLGAVAVLVGARQVGLRLPEVGNHVFVGALIALVLVYELVAGSSAGLWSVSDAVQLALIVGALIASTRSLGRRPIRWAVIGMIALAVLSVQLSTGDGGVGWDDWGGLHLTLFITFAGIAFSFPLGVLVALGRRSSLPALRTCRSATSRSSGACPSWHCCSWASTSSRSFFPDTVEPPGPLARALIVIALFESAYIAETVRGGLQSVPRGQVEAAHAARPVAGVDRARSCCPKRCGR